MKKQIILFLTCIVSALSLFSQTPVEANGQLSISGSKIINKNKDTVCFAGPSLFWSNTGWGGEKFYNEDVVSWVATDLKAPIIRASMGIEENGGFITDETKNKNRITTVIDAAIAEGIYVIVDWHSHTAELNEVKAAAFFREIAQKYGSYPNIMYEIYNEPLKVSWSQTIKPYAQVIINAIRAYDSDNIIIVGTPQWSQKVDDAANDPITGAINIAYSMHFYAGTHTDWLRTRTANAIESGICIVVTEWGTIEASGDGDVATDEVAKWVDFMKEYKLTNCNWALNNKAEGASFLNVSASSYGYWDQTDFTASGMLVYDLIKNWEGNVVGIDDVAHNRFNIAHVNQNGILIVNNEFSDFSYSIINLQGQVLLDGKSKNEIALNSFPQGMYIIQIQDNNSNYTYKFLK